MINEPLSAAGGAGWFGKWIKIAKRISKCKER
jgi:hypothetical protein